MMHIYVVIILWKWRSSKQKGVQEGWWKGRGMVVLPVTENIKTTCCRVEITMREKRAETQDSSYLAVLKTKYRKREHWKKSKSSWKTPLTHHTALLGHSFALWISQSFLAGGPCGPRGKLSEEATRAGVSSCHVTCAMTSIPVVHRCSPGRSAGPLLEELYLGQPLPARAQHCCRFEPGWVITVAQTLWVRHCKTLRAWRKVRLWVRRVLFQWGCFGGHPPIWAPAFTTPLRWLRCRWHCRCHIAWQPASLAEWMLQADYLSSNCQG